LRFELLNFGLEFGVTGLSRRLLGQYDGGSESDHSGHHYRTHAGFKVEHDFAPFIPWRLPPQFTDP
jgi:hypothetical protein